MPIQKDFKISLYQRCIKNPWYIHTTFTIYPLLPNFFEQRKQMNNDVACPYQMLHTKIVLS